MKLVYPAIFSPCIEKEGYTVTVPDLPGCVSEGSSLAEAIEMGTDAASGWVLGELEDGNSIPPATDYKALKPDADSFINLLVLDMDSYAEKYGEKAVIGGFIVLKDKYSFAALLTYEDDSISIDFPDLPGCCPCADTTDEALKNAKEALGLHLLGMEQDGDTIPAASPITELKPEANQVPVLIDVFMPPVRERINSKYAFPAIFTPEEDGGYSVRFPDLEGCFTCGDDMAGALFMAEDALALVLYGYENDARTIPAPSSEESLKLAPGEFVKAVACDTLEYRKRFNSKAIKKI